MQIGILDTAQRSAACFTLENSETATRGDNHARDEALLIRAAQSGDQAAMQTLLASQEHALLSVCRGILGDVTEAEDAVQETFLQALRALSRPNGFRGDSAFRTWILRIGINLCLDWRRRRRASVPLQEMPVEIQAPHTGPEQTTLARLRLGEALATLPPRHRALLILREQDGYDVGEIAIILGWNTKKVHNELFKARQTLLRWREGEDR